MAASPFDELLSQLGKLFPDSGSAIAILSLVFGIVIPVVLFSSLISYILYAIGLFRVAKSSEMKYPWLSFIPFANIWLLGACADRLVLPTKSHYAAILLSLDIITRFSGILSAVCSFMMLSSVTDPTSSSMAIPVVLPLLLISIVISAGSIAYTVFNYIALYRIFKAFSPSNAVLFIVLSIFISLAYPIIFIAIGGKKPVINQPAQIG